MKNKLILFVVGSIFLGLWACMDSDDTEYEVSRDPQIASFSLSHDSISGLSDVVFVVDQVNGLIYNPDSMAMEYRELIDSMKVLASIEFTSYVSNIELYPQATMDTVFWTGSTENDSIDFSDRVDIKTTALDGLTIKRYQSKLNIHTVLPDTMVWNLYPMDFVDETITKQRVLEFKDGFLMYSQIGGRWNINYATSDNPKEWKLIDSNVGLAVNVDYIIQIGNHLYAPDGGSFICKSSDGTTWNTTTPTPGMSVKSFLGLLDDNTLCVVAQMSGETMLRFMTFKVDEAGNLFFDQEGDEIPDDFPLDELNPVTYEINNTSTLLLVGGARDNTFIQKVWNTSDGLKWEAYNIDSFPYRRGAAAIKYDDKLYLIGGFEEDGTASRDIFISQNRGVAWKETEIGPLPDDFAKRGFVSVVVDDEQYMHLFGGKESISNNVLKEIWRGRINRLGFAN